MKELKKCGVCGKEVKNLGAHSRLAHGKRAVEAGGELLSSAPPSAPTEQKEVRYLSTRARGLVIVVKPAMWGEEATPVGTKMKLYPGKTIEFKNGWFATKDPELIAFLDNYKADKGFPVVRVDNESVPVS